ncbi:MAG: hypothetical protein KGJ02_03800 [Verrucomicrobiota bacterium]|nr:hypothetical protein [Verrucomicrobiota bacterium]
MNLSLNALQSLYGTLLGAFRASSLVKMSVPIFTSVGRRRKITAKSTVNEPRPKGRGMIWEEFRTPPKFGCELPGPKGPGFRRPDELLIIEG